MIREKIQIKTAGGNGQILMALRLFEVDANSGGEITPSMFQAALSRLLCTEITEEEAMNLFNKYDLDGGGTIDSQEFTSQLLPGPLSNTVKGQPAPAQPPEVVPPYLRKAGILGPAPPTPPPMPAIIPGSHSARYDLHMGHT